MSAVTSPTVTVTGVAAAIRSTMHPIAVPAMILRPFAMPVSLSAYSMSTTSSPHPAELKGSAPSHETGRSFPSPPKSKVTIGVIIKIVNLAQLLEFLILHQLHLLLIIQKIMLIMWLNILLLKNKNQNFPLQLKENI